MTTATFGAGGMTVVGFWEPGRGFNPLGALHLIAGDRGQGLTLVHFSAQLEPCLTQENTLHTMHTP